MTLSCNRCLVVLKDIAVGINVDIFDGRAHSLWSWGKRGSVGRRRRNIDWLGLVDERLASWLALCALGKCLVWGAEVGQRAWVGGGNDWVALDLEVEIGQRACADLAAGANNLVVEVLLEVRLNVSGSESLELTALYLAIKAAGKWDGARGHDGVVAHVHRVT